MGAVDGVRRLEEPGVGPKVSSESLTSESIVLVGSELHKENRVSAQSRS